MPSGGGIGVKLTIPLPRYDLQDISPDASEMLLRQIGSDENYSLWIMPIVGGPARRVGDLRVDAAAFTADGKSVTYSKGPRAYVCDPEGQNSRLLVSMKGDVLRIRWSPRGDILRFTVNDPTLHENSLWEVRADGANLHPLLPGWERSKWEWMLGWSRDARWFAFSAAHDNGRDIWIMQHDPSSSRPDQGPFQLTTGPIEFDLPTFGVEDNRIYAVGVQHRGELLRFNPTKRAFDPYLGGISADQLDFSHDGKWVTYVTYPERVLWRAQLDGSDGLKLNEKLHMVLAPKWSPDGRQIAYLARTSRDSKWQAFVVSANGGISRPVAPGTGEITGAAWADHGESLVLSSPEWEGLRTLNLATATIADLKGSAHLHGGIASPSGRYLIGSVDDGNQLEIMDLHTLERRPLAHDANYPAWSSDERYVYLNRFDGSKPALYRVRLTDMKEEKVFDLHAFPAGGSWSTWSTVAPDGSLLLLRDLGGADLYAIDWEPK